WLVDFGKETFGYIKLQGIRGKGKVRLYYGESKEEALAINSCETLDEVDVDQTQPGDITLPGSRAFRYVNVRTDDGLILDNVSMLYEFAPVGERGSFRSSDTLLNRIYDVAKYTLHLNTREFFTDGIKRDRWIWSGDAYQSYLMNYYLFFDAPTVTRTLLALRGKDPVSSHINTIMDYTFYWFLGIHDYYQYTGDKKFIKQFYPRMQSLMEYCLSRRNKEGLMEGLAGDWVFIDWADGLSKQGAVSFEQLLLCRSLETMATCATLMEDKAGAARYQSLADDLKKKIFDYYWDESKHALVHSRVNGAPFLRNGKVDVTRYANMFAIFFNYLSDAQKQGVKSYVLLNDSIQKIVTPYMRFYELESLCAMGEQGYVLDQMKSYWGGMLDLGATSFWEEYNPAKQGAEHYAMYGRPFGKSLCHAWGASPIYLLGKYYLGVTPTTPGYEQYSVTPVLGGLRWMQGSVPTPKGDVSVYCDAKKITVHGAAGGTGLLHFKSKSKPLCNETSIRVLGNNQYELTVEAGKMYTVIYQNLQ
ncbi:MAG: alpha-rhamnosidase, partial [Bacteroidetes bacterium]|nr:alpha-rhamnosidase [Bacteroidota bacterium]